MPRSFFLFLFSLLISATTFIPSAKPNDELSSPITVKSEVDRAEVTIGDPIEYKVTIKHLPEIRILTNIRAPDSDILKVDKISDIQEELADGYLATGKTFRVKTFRLGNFILDPVKIEFLDLQGEKQFIETDKIYIRVKSVAEGEDKQDIRGVKGVVSIPQKILKAIFIGAGIFAFILIGTLIFLALRKPKEEEKLPPTPLEAHEEALINLQKLFDSDLIRNDKHKKYFLLLSEILRVYLERRFGILAVESTTTEIGRSLKSKNATSHELREKILAVLEAADLAKFAKWKPQPTEILTLNKQSLSVVEESKPEEKPEEEESAHD